ncbi:hypothetical protein [Undibacterium danionis]|uniref:Lipoprotein n=1 Tax=Undibacterium danionis TaxID=1812100 RepID=A0ABV6IF20_9BURK
MFKFAVFSFLLLMSLTSSACSCGRNLKEQVGEADRIIVAKVVSARYQSGTNENSFPHVQANMAVIRLLKGKAAENVVVETSLPGNGCGVSMTIGQTYIIFLRKDTQYIGMCDGSHELLGFEERTMPDEILALVRTLPKK